MNPEIVGLFCGLPAVLGGAGFLTLSKLRTRHENYIDKSRDPNSGVKHKTTIPVNTNWLKRLLRIGPPVTKEIFTPQGTWETVDDAIPMIKEAFKAYLGWGVAVLGVAGMTFMALGQCSGPNISLPNLPTVGSPSSSGDSDPLGFAVDTVVNIAGHIGNAVGGIGDGLGYGYELGSELLGGKTRSQFADEITQREYEKQQEILREALPEYHGPDRSLPDWYRNYPVRVMEWGLFGENNPLTREIISLESQGYELVQRRDTNYGEAAIVKHREREHELIELDFDYRYIRGGDGKVSRMQIMGSGEKTASTLEAYGKGEELLPLAEAGERAHLLEQVLHDPQGPHFVIVPEGETSTMVVRFIGLDGWPIYKMLRGIVVTEDTRTISRQIDGWNNDGELSRVIFPGHALSEPQLMEYFQQTYEGGEVIDESTFDKYRNGFRESRNCPDDVIYSCTQRGVCKAVTDTSNFQGTTITNLTHCNAQDYVPLPNQQAPQQVEALPDQAVTLQFEPYGEEHGTVVITCSDYTPFSGILACSSDGICNTNNGQRISYVEALSMGCVKEGQNDFSSDGQLSNELQVAPNQAEVPIPSVMPEVSEAGTLICPEGSPVPNGLTCTDGITCESPNWGKISLRDAQVMYGCTKGP